VRVRLRRDGGCRYSAVRRSVEKLVTAPVAILLLYLLASGVVLNACVLFWLWRQAIGWLIEMRIRA
jgi:hypothetical protein